MHTRLHVRRQVVDDAEEAVGQVRGIDAGRADGVRSHHIRRCLHHARSLSVEKRHRQAIVGKDLACDFGDLRKHQADVEDVGQRLEELLGRLEVCRAFAFERCFTAHRRQTLTHQCPGDLIGEQLHEEDVILGVIVRAMREQPEYSPYRLVVEADGGADAGANLAGCRAHREDARLGGIITEPGLRPRKPRRYAIRPRRHEHLDVVHAGREQNQPCLVVVQDPPGNRADRRKQRSGIAAVRNGLSKIVQRTHAVQFGPGKFDGWCHWTSRGIAASIPVARQIERRGSIVPQNLCPWDHVVPAGTLDRRYPALIVRVHLSRFQRVISETPSMARCLPLGEACVF